MPCGSSINDVTVLEGRGILLRHYLDLSNKKRDDGGGAKGVKNCPKLRDVIYGGPPTQKTSIFLCIPVTDAGSESASSEEYCHQN